MSRLLPLVAAVLLALGAGSLAAAAPNGATVPGPAAPADPGPYAWAQPAADALVAQGLWPELATDDLSRDATRADIARALGILTGTPRTSRVPAAPARAWIANLLFVRALGLEPERRAIQHLHTENGTRLRMPRLAGSEVLARELGLLHNYPAQDDALERSRRQVLRLADIVGMLDAARNVPQWKLDSLARYTDIVLPDLTPRRRAVVQTALLQIGQPYVWGGDWPGRRSPWGYQAHGGFDCSGLVWWSFKGGRQVRRLRVGVGIRGRTADQMAFERRRERRRVGRLEPGDLIFFGPGRLRSRRGTIAHVGISLGNGWMIHSSGSRAGVSISYLADYWPSAMAWGRAVRQLGP